MPRIRIQGIFPRKPLLVDRRKLEIEANRALNKTANLIRSDFRKTVRTWTDKPAFRKVGPQHGAVEVFTTNRIYFFLNDGTRRHFVAPRKAKALRFQAGYTAKTRPRTIGSRGGGSFGPTRFSLGHEVSGIKARKFDETIAERRQKTLRNFIRVGIMRSI